MVLTIVIKVNYFIHNPSKELEAIAKSYLNVSSH